MTLTHDDALVRRHRFTVDDYHRMAAAGVLHEDDRVELIEGEVVVMSPISNRHAACVDRLTELLVHALARRAIVRVQNPLRLDRYSEPQPDLVVARRRDDFYAADGPGPGDALLAIEVGDSSVKFDRLVKAPLYARSGVQEVWLVDLGAEEVSVCREPAAGAYQDVQVRRRGEALALAALPDVVVQVVDILG
ncbi:MAG: Uma2 family endonuclease [Planctomycetes bacterium]|nr:Uma2 family endonuclease [Planctomycetota bacterium]